ncbi:MAG: hypothetical protein ACWGQW_01175 [bacterium]
MPTTYGVKPLRKLQFGRETTAGTAVAATTIWRGEGTIKDAREIVFPAEDIGYLSGTDRQYTASYYATLGLSSVEATFEQLPYIFEMGIQSVGTGSADGSGSDYIYTYTMPTTAANTHATYTIEGGDNAGAEEMEYAFVESFTIEGGQKEALMVSADLGARQVSTASFTGAATLPAVKEALFTGTSVYIDDVDGTLGTTEIGAENLVNLTVNVTTGIKPVWSANGQLYFEFTKRVMPEVTLDLVLEHTATTIAEKSKWQAATPRQIRLLTQGPALSTAGTTYSYKTLIMDFAGQYEDFSALDDTDGNDTITATFRARYNATADLFAVFTVVNELSSLP